MLEMIVVIHGYGLTLRRHGRAADWVLHVGWYPRIVRVHIVLKEGPSGATS